MKRNSNDKNAAKLMMKKSSSHLKIAIIMFLITLIVTSSICLLYAKQYTQYEKDFLQNVAIKTLNVTQSYKDNKISTLDEQNITDIKQVLSQTFDQDTADIIPVYSFRSGISSQIQNLKLYAIDEQYCYLLGLEEMQDDSIYFTTKQSDPFPILISQITVDNSNFSSSGIEQFVLQSKDGVSLASPILSSQNEEHGFGDEDQVIGFVNLDILNEITDIMFCDQVSQDSIVYVNGVYICVQNLADIGKVQSILLNENYSVQTPTDIFENFGETVAVSTLVFLLSSIILLFMTTSNIMLSFNSFYRVQQRDFGVLEYMGYAKKRIYKMYTRNLLSKFAQITLICTAFIIALGAILFELESLIILAIAILILLVFILVLYLAICRFIIKRYVYRDFLALIRESKEFE